MTVKLNPWLRAQLGADERAILSGWDSDGKARVATMWTGATADGPGYTTVASDRGGDGVWVADGREVDDAHQIQVLWDPARELAAIAVKRRILRRHAECGFGTGYCDDSGSGWELGDDGVCADKLDLAALYADRPGFRREWKMA